jgi:hypothetical protein
MSARGWLWAAGFSFIAASAIPLHRYYKAIEGPVIDARDSALTAVAAKPIFANCTAVNPVRLKGAAGHRFADPQVKFSYVFEGVTYQSERYSRTNRYQLLTPQECEKFVQAFVGSQSVTAWVDPKNPRYAALQPMVPVPWLEYGLLLLGGLSCAGAAYLQFVRRKVQ